MRDVIGICGAGGKQTPRSAYRLARQPRWTQTPCRADRFGLRRCDYSLPGVTMVESSRKPCQKSLYGMRPARRLLSLPSGPMMTTLTRRSGWKRKDRPTCPPADGSWPGPEGSGTDSNKRASPWKGGTGRRNRSPRLDILPARACTRPVRYRSTYSRGMHPFREDAVFWACHSGGQSLYCADRSRSVSAYRGLPEYLERLAASLEPVKDNLISERA